MTPGLVGGDLVLHLHRLDDATTSPSSTAALLDRHLKTLPCSGDASVSPPAPSLAGSRRPRTARRPARAGGAAVAAAGDAVRATSKRLPDTSTV